MTSTTWMKTVNLSLQRFFKAEVLPLIANLQLAILLLLAIALFSVIGTVIEQGKSLTFYQTNYPEHPALFGFLTWKVISTLGLDHVYRTWWYLALLILLGTTLGACTSTRQLPALTAARRWKFYDQPRQFEKLALSTELETGSLQSLAFLLEKRRYRIFHEVNFLYARKGLVGRVGPIVVHISMLLILLGAIWGAMTGFMALEDFPSGETFKISHIVEAGPWFRSQLPSDLSVRVNRFWIDYTPEGGIDQFYSDLSILDSQKHELKHKTIHVNDPLHFQGLTLYQTNWGIDAVQYRVNNSPILQSKMAPLKIGGKKRVWGTWVPTKPDSSEGIFLMAQDLQGTLTVYDTSGNEVSTVRTGMSTQVNGVTLAIIKVVGKTGLQIKADPSIPIVYTGFGLLMLGGVMCYFSHSQVWALQKEGHLYIGGRTNRAQVTFERELLEILKILDQEPKEQIPELSLTPSKQV